MPITLRDQIIGEFSLSAPPESVQWSSDDLLLAEAVITQVALAIENARLLEETQSSLAATNRLARRERMIADVSQKLTAGLEIKNVLQIAADELQRGTNSRRAVVRLTIPTAEEQNERCFPAVHFCLHHHRHRLAGDFDSDLVITYRASTRAAQTISQLKEQNVSLEQAMQKRVERVYSAVEIGRTALGGA